MEVTYKNNTLRKYAENAKFSVQKLGMRRSELYLRRIGDLIAAETLDSDSIPSNGVKKKELWESKQKHQN